MKGDCGRYYLYPGIGETEGTDKTFTGESPRSGDIPDHPVQDYYHKKSVNHDNGIIKKGITCFS